MEDKGTNNGIFFLKRSQQISRQDREPLYKSFVDCTAAFDQLDREVMYLCVRKRFPNGADLPWLDILEHLYSRKFPVQV